MADKEQHKKPDANAFEGEGDDFEEFAAEGTYSSVTSILQRSVSVFDPLITHVYLV